MLTAAEIDAMRLTVESALPDVCDIQSVTQGDAGPYGGAESVTTRASGVPCRLSPGATSEERAEDERLVGREAWVLTVAHDVNVSTAAGESLRVEANSRTYEVVDSTSDRSWELGTRIQLVRRVL